MLVVIMSLPADDVGGGVGSVADADFAVGVLQVPFDGVDADDQGGGDFVVGVAGREEFEDLGFAAGEAAGAGAVGGRAGAGRAGGGRGVGRRGGGGRGGGGPGAGGRAGAGGGRPGRGRPRSR